MAISSSLTRLNAYSSEFADTAHAPNSLNRFSGGSGSTTTPYISGYWYCSFILPEPVFTTNREQLTRWLVSSSAGYTPHTEGTTKVDMEAMGGLGSSFISGRTITRQFSVAFNEYQKLPVYNAIKIWNGIFDRHEGVALQELRGDKYKGIAYVFLCRPQITNNGKLTIDDVEEFYGYDGVYPETVPTDALNSDIATNDKANPNIQFNFDGAPITKADAAGDLEKILETLGSLESYEKVFSSIIGQ